MFIDLGQLSHEIKRSVSNKNCDNRSRLLVPVKHFMRLSALACTGFLTSCSAPNTSSAINAARSSEIQAIVGLCTRSANPAECTQRSLISRDKNALDATSQAKQNAASAAIKANLSAVPLDAIRVFGTLKTEDVVKIVTLENTVNLPDMPLVLMSVRAMNLSSATGAPMGSTPTLNGFESAPGLYPVYSTLPPSPSVRPPTNIGAESGVPAQQVPVTPPVVPEFNQALVNPPVNPLPIGFTLFGNPGSLRAAN